MSDPTKPASLKNAPRSGKILTAMLSLAPTATLLLFPGASDVALRSPDDVVEYITGGEVTAIASANIVLPEADDSPPEDGGPEPQTLYGQPASAATNATRGRLAHA